MRNTTSHRHAYIQDNAVNQGLNTYTIKDYRKNNLIVITIITRQLRYKIAISEKTNLGIDDFFSQDLNQNVTNKNSKIKHRLT